MLLPETKDGQEPKQVTPFPTPDGTPLLMRIKRAREMEKWDSSNSVEKMGVDRALAARQASTQSLNNPLPLHKQTKRMSVPAMNLADDVQALVRTNTQSSVRTRVNKGDLKGIQEEHEELNEGKF